MDFDDLDDVERDLGVPELSWQVTRPNVEQTESVKHEGAEDEKSTFVLCWSNAKPAPSTKTSASPNSHATLEQQQLRPRGLPAPPTLEPSPADSVQWVEDVSPETRTGDSDNVEGEVATSDAVGASSSISADEKNEMLSPMPLARRTQLLLASRRRETCPPDPQTAQQPEPDPDCGDGDSSVEAEDAERFGISAADLQLIAGGTQKRSPAGSLPVISPPFWLRSTASDVPMLASVHQVPYAESETASTAAISSGGMDAPKVQRHPRSFSPKVAQDHDPAGSWSGSGGMEDSQRHAMPNASHKPYPQQVHERLKKLYEDKDRSRVGSARKEHARPQRSGFTNFWQTPSEQ